MLIENSKVELHTCHVRNGMAVGLTIVDEANVSMNQCKIQNHQQFHIIVDASGLKLQQSIIQFGQSGGVYGNEHAKIMMHHTTIRESQPPYLYQQCPIIYTILHV